MRSPGTHNGLGGQGKRRRGKQEGRGPGRQLGAHPLQGRSRAQGCKLPISARSIIVVERLGRLGTRRRRVIWALGRGPITAITVTITVMVTVTRRLVRLAMAL